jgi:DNA-binding transcriptional MerR regulator
MGAIPRYMTTQEVAEALRTPAESVRFWRSTGKGPKSRRIGRRVLYDEADVISWLKEQETADDVAQRARGRG